MACIESAARGTVSILIPCFDAEAWVGDAVECALAQDWPAIEVIAADDGSTDRTLEVLASFGSAIRVIAAPHRGANSTRNLLLAAARGEWLSFLDADDTVPPGKIRRQMEAVAGAPADLVVAPFFHDGRTLGMPRSRDWWVELAMGRMGITSSNLWRRQAVAAVGGFDPARPRLQEYHLIFAMLRAGAHVVVSPEPGAVHRLLNPRSVYLRHVDRSLLDRGRLVVRVLAHLASRGELAPARRDVLVAEAMRFTRDLWVSGPRESGRAIERALASVLADFPRRTADPGRVRAWIHRHLGLDLAGHYDGLSRVLRPFRNPRSEDRGG